MPRTLKVIFTGVCTFAPTNPADASQTLSNFFVLMPAARAPRLGPQGGIIARHQAYLYVPDQILGTVPEPAMLVRDNNLGLCNVYLMDHARITFDRTPVNPLRYFVDEQTRVIDRPDEDDPTIAPRNDSRWVADSAEVFPGGARLRPDVDPAGNITNGLVTMVVHLTGGLIEAGDACNVAQPRTFQPAQVPMPERLLAPELTVTMEFADDTASIRLMVGRLDPNERVSGFTGDSLELFWHNTDMIQLRIGNDTLDEIVALRDDGRCAPRDLPLAEAEFALHYGLLEVAPSDQSPLPTRGGGQGDVGGCIGFKVRYPA